MIRLSFLLAAALVLAAAVCPAQQTASIRASVQDSTGAVVGGADVRATNLETGQSLQTVSTLSGI
ncbi:MAG: carboxypeptidase-like regulatory domain-containing protein [Bryobacterales bacterium]|nr:carboxypeptidase-like regulatory domain-containing protein [Bryobacterales bacterium]